MQNFENFDPGGFPRLPIPARDEAERLEISRAILEEKRQSLCDPARADYVIRQMQRLAADPQAKLPPRCSVGGCGQDAAPGDTLCYDCREQSDFLLNWEARQEERAAVQRAARARHRAARAVSRRRWHKAAAEHRDMWHAGAPVLAACTVAVLLAALGVHWFGGAFVLLAFGVAATVAFSAGIVYCLFAGYPRKRGW